MMPDYPKSILAYRFDDHHTLHLPSHAVQWAMSLAALSQACLDTLLATQQSSMANLMGFSGRTHDTTRQEETAADQATGAAAQALKASFVAAGLTGDVETLQGSYPRIRTALTQRARMYDTVVTDAASDAASLQRELLTDMLFNAARPVIVIPSGPCTSDLQTVVVGWDGSGPATRALYDALPLLHAAATVHVVSIVGEKPLPQTVDAHAMMRALGRHGISAVAHDIPLAGGDAAQTLLHHAVSNQANLLVTGAYAHSRLRQWIFGGVTGALLTDCPMPLFLSH